MTTVRTPEGFLLLGNNVVTPDDFIALRQNPATIPFVRASFDDAGDVTPTDVWPESAPLVLPTSAVAMEIVSTSANDTGGGTGAQTALVVGLDANWGRISQVVTLAGAVAVPIPIALRIVEQVRFTAAGSSGGNEGIVRVQLSGGGAVQSHSPVDFGQSIQAHFGIAAGDTFVLKGFIVNTAQLVAANYQFIVQTEGQPIFRSATFKTGLIGEADFAFRMAFVLPEKSTVRFIASFASGIANGVSQILFGFSIANSSLAGGVLPPPFPAPS